MAVKPDRTQLIGLGAPPVPLVSVGNFTKLDSEMIQNAWQIVGPSVGRNLGNFRPVPLWAVFAACYLEGFDHGVGIMNERGQPEPIDPMKEET